MSAINKPSISTRGKLKCYMVIWVMIRMFMKLRFLRGTSTDVRKNLVFINVGVRHT